MKNHFLSPSRKLPWIFISKSNWNPSCKASPLYTVFFSGCQRNKWSDGIWKELTIREVTFSFLSPHLLLQQGKVPRVRKDKASPMLKLASLSNKIFYVFLWIMKRKKGSCVSMLPEWCAKGSPRWESTSVLLERRGGSLFVLKILKRRMFQEKGGKRVMFQFGYIYIISPLEL